MSRTQDLIKDKFDDLNERLDKQKQAVEAQLISKHAQEAADDIANGIELLKAGDSLGGSAALLRGIGAIANFASIAGPVGTILGSVLSALTGIIGAILDALGPEKESLEEKIGKMITEQTLKEEYVTLKSSEDRWLASGMITLKHLANTRDLVGQAIAAGQSTDDQIKDWIRKFNQDREQKNEKPIDCFYPNKMSVKDMAGGFSWEYLKEATEYEKKLSDIQHAINTLEKNRIPSLEWQGLSEQLIGYMFRWYASLPALAGVVDSNGQTMFQQMLDETKAQYHEGLQQLSFQAKNIAALYQLWHTPGKPDYAHSTTQIFNSLMSRVGLTGSETSIWQEVPGFSYCSTFAVSSRGTVFTTTTGLTAGAGRTSFGPAGGEQEAEQIFIGELPNSGSVIVAVTHNRGYDLSFTTFNDLSGGAWEENEEEWTPNVKRWAGHWQKHSFPFRILTASIFPLNEKEYQVFVLGLEEDDSVQLYDFNVTHGARPVDFFRWKPEEVTAYFDARFRWDIGPWLWLGPFPCAISGGPGILAVQLGNDVKVQSRGEPDTLWDLQKLISDSGLDSSDLLVFEAKFFGLQTFAVSSNKGFYHRYWDSETKSIRWAHIENFHTTNFSITPNTKLDQLLMLMNNSAPSAEVKILE